MLDKILSGIGGNSSSMLSSLLTPFLQQQIGDAGTIRSAEIDAANKSVQITIDLNGESRPLVLQAAGYSLSEKNGKAVLQVASWSCASHPWIDSLGHKFLPAVGVPLPVPYALAATFL